ncbi:zeta toxin family protein [Polaromonas sp. CG_23.6]|uniref:zeta toxin family protein n=1 Tax=unclassified Polaromonas TaxID=2638319 RepID=UPI001A1BAA32|nr:zeta toxin family protein [Polaromonas sp. CG_23.6]MBG6071365.1 putative ABC-type ATPase [Polaromonas sp. CG_9.7]MBG6113365.1 putative ABC-type ATPase [Polaromonas sp. CG_9.2]MDH6183177.1 putative ABC-type ATPase [Polaromonas sp. CG_23.6]
MASGTIENHLEFVNADLYERDCLQHVPDLQKRSEAAREWADTRRETLLDARAGFVSETVFSHESKLDLIRHAQSLGYQVVLYVVALDDPQRLVARVSQRVREGGHNVPASRILGRYPRTMAYLGQAVRLADLAFLYDAVEVELGAHRLVALCEKALTTVLADELPLWAAAMLAAK